MGKKYIIELEEPEMFDDRKFYTCSQMPWWAVSENIVENLTPYTEPDTNEAYQRGVEDGAKSVENWNEQEKKLRMDEAYQRGLNDAEEGKATCQYCDYQYLDDTEEPCKKCCKAYLNKFKPKAKEEQIQVGDEVIPRETEYDDMIVTRLWKDDYDSDCIDAIGFDGRIGSFLVSRVSKTGKHYEIAEVLEKMRGE